MPIIAIIVNAKPPPQATGRRFENSNLPLQKVNNAYHNFGASAIFPR